MSREARAPVPHRSSDIAAESRGTIAQTSPGVLCVADDFTASPQAKSFAVSHVHHHGTPFILIVDPDAHVVQADRRSAWRELVETIGPVHGERLPERLARIVLRHAHSGRSEETATVVVVGEDLVVSVVSFAGTKELFACTIWQLRRDSVLDDARRRFALTNRECEMLDRILSGDASSTIAQTLSISLATVEWHTKRLLHKTDSLNRTQLAVRVLGWLPDAF
jgi:DNA-binding CsgD family transcriptional regulator